jgi:hypothetical protein
LAAFIFVRVFDDREFHEAGIAVAGGGNGVGLHGAQIRFAGHRGLVLRRNCVAGRGGGHAQEKKSVNRPFGGAATRAKPA